MEDEKKGLGSSSSSSSSSSSPPEVQLKDGLATVTNHVNSTSQQEKIKNGTLSPPLLGEEEQEEEQEELEQELEGEKDGTDGDADSSPGTKSSKGRSLRDLNSTQRYLLLALCILYFALYVLLSLMGPFFPIQAQQKGLTPQETGLVLGLSWLVMFLMAPVIGYLITKVQLKLLATGGVASAGLLSIMFGFLQFVNDRGTFLGVALALRLLEGVAVATFCITAWSVLIATMGNAIQMAMAVLMAVQGVAVIISPLIGGLLYKAGGFLAPFVSMGTLVVIATPISWVVLRKIPLASKTNVGSVKTFIANVGVIITAVHVTAFTLTFKFLESYISLYIEKQFDYGPQMAGVILSVACLCFVLTTVLWAQVVRCLGCAIVMFIASILAVIANSLMAPGHFLRIEAHPWQIFSMTCLFGVAFSASQAPAIPRLLELARQRKMPENYLTYGLVSSCYSGAFDIGCFAGPLLGGPFYNYLGFGWSTFALGVLLAVTGSCVLAHHVYERCRSSKGETKYLLSTGETKDQLSSDKTYLSEAAAQPSENGTALKSLLQTGSVTTFSGP